MIQLDRKTIGRFRTALRKSLLHGRRGAKPVVVVRTGPEGLTLYAQCEGTVLAWHDDTPHPVARLVLPFDSLAELEGKGMVALNHVEDGMVRASWDEAGFPRSNTFSVKPADGAFDLPPTPSELRQQDAGTIMALNDAMQSASQDGVRFALNRIQLRGQTGEIVGTDGRQLLIQSGFEFGWKEDLLINNTPFFGWREIQAIQEIQLGCTDQHACFVIGPWTLWLAIDREGRFPNTHKVLPSEAPGTSLLLDPSDADFLAQALEKMPYGEDGQDLVTLDLNGHVRLRMRNTDKTCSTEVRLSRSTCLGSPLQISLNRNLLARALALGFREGQVVSADRPIVFHDERRKYVTTPFPLSTIVSAGANDVQIDSATTRRETRAAPQPPKRKEPMKLDPKAPLAEEKPRSKANAGNKGFAHLLEEAMSLQTHLREALARNHRLVADLKQYRRQARVVQTTLRQLRDVAA